MRDAGEEGIDRIDLHRGCGGTRTRAQKGTKGQRAEAAGDGAEEIAAGAVRAGEHGGETIQHRRRTLARAPFGLRVASDSATARHRFLEKATVYAHFTISG